MIHGYSGVMLILSACALDSGLNKTDAEPVFDTGETEVPFDTDTDTTEPVDTAETAGPPPACDDQTFPAATVVQDDTCVGAPEIGTFTPVIEWTNTDPGVTFSTPVVGQLTDDDGDGVITDADTPDIAVFANDGVTWAISGDGTTLWSSAAAVAGEGTPAIGDLDGDGFPEVVVAGTTNTVALHGEDGSIYWSVVGLEESLCAAVGIADLDADGDPEVIVGRVILDGQSGAERGRGDQGIGSGYSGIRAAAISSTVDIDRDGQLEVVVGNALYDADGNTIWENGERDGFTAVADFDGDPEGEIVVSEDGSVRLQDDDGTVLWSANYLGERSGPPTIADFDGDGEPEIGVAGHSQYIVLDPDGTELWSRPTDDNSSGITGSSVFDFEGDGAMEVVYADENDLFVFDGASGAVKLQETTHASLTCTEYPTVADVDNDGHAEIIYTSSRYSGPETGVTVIGDASNSWMAGRRVWNQYGYNITNVEDDGGIPVTPDVNWDTYNNFRTGDNSRGFGVPAADIYLVLHDVCGVECEEGRVTLWLSLANRGTVDVDDPMTVDVYAETDAGEVLAASLAWTAGVPAGVQTAAESLEFEVAPPVYALRAEVRSDATDCDLSNNTAQWTEAVCL